MTLKNSPNGGGTNADKTISKVYYSYRFENGQFKQPNWTVSQMHDFLKGKMKEMVSRFFSPAFALMVFLNLRDGKTNERHR